MTIFTSSVHFFSQRPIALDYVRNFLPKDLWKNLDLRTFKLSNNSYIDAKLSESISDLVYTYKWKGQEELQLCLLLEHKSYLVKHPQVQLLRYMVNSWEANLANRESLKIIIPIIIYHGEQKWHYKPFKDSFGELGQLLKRFIPHFDYLLTDLSDYSDEQILSLRVKFLVNGFLAMKHKADEEYFVKNSNRIFTNGEQYLNNPEGDRNLQQILNYIFSITDMDDANFEKFTKDMNEKIKTKASTTYTRAVQKGIKLGIKQGIEQGIEQERKKQELLIINFMESFPNTTDQEIASIFKISLEWVKEIRKKRDKQ